MKETEYMNLQQHKRVIISGGGTGGHVFPAISIANALRRINPEIEILFVGAEGKIEMEKIPSAGYRIVGLPVEGLKRNNLLGNFIVFIRLLKSLRQAGRIIKDFRPDVVVGVGGYASGPILRQAGKRGIPTLIQEQNSYAGITNKLLAKRAYVICVAYDGMEKYFPANKIIKTGNPVRQSFNNLDILRDEAFDFFKLKKELPLILVLGGSLGAGTINRGLSQNIQRMVDSGLQWLWQTGRYYYEDVKALVSLSLTDHIFVLDFINRMEYAFAVADVIVSRAGAGTISELCLVGKPVILIPSPNVAEDHQTMNARALVENEAAVMIPDDQAVTGVVNEAIRLVGDDDRKRMLAENIAKLAYYDADTKIAKEILKLTEE